MHSNGVVAKRLLAFTIDGCAVVAFRSNHASVNSYRSYNEYEGPQSMRLFLVYTQGG
jgi:hypothetical protein